MGLSTSISESGSGENILRSKSFSIEIPPTTGSLWQQKCELLAPYTFVNEGGDPLSIPDQDGDKVVIRRDVAMDPASSQMTWFTVVGDDGCRQPWTMYISSSYAMPSRTLNFSNASSIGRRLLFLGPIPESGVPVWVGDSKVSVFFDDDDGYFLVLDEAVDEFVGGFTGQITCEGALTGTVTINFADLDGLPEAPSISGYSNDTGAMLISWVDGLQNIPNITAHKIYLNDSFDTQTGEPSPYDYTGLESGTPISVRVSSVNTNGEGALSDPIVITPG